MYNLFIFDFLLSKINTGLSLCAGNERDRHKARSGEDSLFTCYYRSFDLREILVAKCTVFELPISTHGNGKIIYYMFRLSYNVSFFFFFYYYYVLLAGHKAFNVMWNLFCNSTCRNLKLTGNDLHKNDWE